MSEEVPKLRIRVHRSEDCKPVPIDGAWGGPSGTREVFIALYRDFPDHPALVIRDQVAKKEVPEVESEYVEMTREVFLLAIMQPDVARAISKLLLNSADAVEAASERENARRPKGAQRG
jgi:hypothetical protein